MTSTEIVTYETMSMESRWTYAETIGRAAAMLPSGVRAGDPSTTAANAFLIMETGAMLDLHPIAALSSVNIIEGKPSLSADLMVSVVRNAGHTVRVQEEGTVEGGDYKATVTLIRADDPDYPTTITWTPHRAARAGLCKYEPDQNGVWRVTATSRNGSPLPWQSYTEALCKARAKSEACRDGAGDSLNGARYTPEELGSDVDASGDPIITSMGADEPAAEEKPSALPKQTKRATNGKQGTRRKPAEKPAPAPEEPQEQVEDAEVVEETPAPEKPAQEPVSDEREERERMAAEQTRQVSERERIIETAEQVDRADAAAVKAWNDENGKATGHYITSDAETERHREAMAGAPDEPTGDDDAEPEFFDRKTGTVYESQEEMDAAMRERVQANRAERQEQPAEEPKADGFDETVASHPSNYGAQMRAARTQDQLLKVWMAAQEAQALTTELKQEILARKAELEAISQ